MLNALLWCFYGETTKRFEKKEAILNYDAKQSGRTEAFVEVIFEHNDKRYRAKRYFDARKTTSDSLIVTRIQQGSQIPIEPPDTFINTVIPREMAPHFLFDGEHAEVFLGEDNRNSIEKSIQEILGCGVIKTAIDDLRYLTNVYKREIASTMDSGKVSQLEEERQSFLQLIEIAESNKEKLISKRNIIEEQVEDIEQNLRNSAATKELQRRRDDLKQDKDRLAISRAKTVDEKYKWLGENGRYVVSTKISAETFKFLDEKEHRGRIPSPYNEEFVKDILNSEECICGTKLPQDSLERNKVASLLNKAADQTMRDRITKVRARITSLKNERVKAPGRLRRLSERLAEVESEYDEKEAKLEEVSARLKDIDIDDIAERESRRRELSGKLKNTIREVGKLDSDVDRYKIKVANIDRQIKLLAEKNSKALKYVKRSSLCESVRGELETRLNEEEEKARNILRSRITKVLDSTSRKTLNLRMTDEYIISLENQDGLTLPKEGLNKARFSAWSGSSPA
ncbi:MAG: hypothetical protein F4Y34_11915, partial [Gammaproteobacteria bacterium]|nr:hypothetical protein [Gammaproteobacteria bacterium]